MFCSKICELKHKSDQQKNTESKPVAPIKRVSDKRAKEEREYSKKRKKWLRKPENKFCPVTGELATQVHHKKGRIGFADDWARENNVPLLLDERFWLAVSDDGHKTIELNPGWAKDMGYSVPRLTEEYGGPE